MVQIFRSLLKRLRGKTQKSENVPPYLRADHGSIAALVVGNVDMRRRADDED